MKLTIIKCKIEYLIYSALSLGYVVFIILNTINESGKWMHPTDVNDTLILIFGYVVFLILFFASLIGGLILLILFLKTLTIKTEK